MFKALGQKLAINSTSVKSFFNTIADTVSAAASTASPSTQQLIKATWERIEGAYQDFAVSKNAINDPLALAHSSFQDSLAELVAYIAQDEHDVAGELARGYTGTSEAVEVCIKEEYVAKLCAMSLPDRPPGIRAVVTETLENLIKVIDQSPFLEHASVHSPLLHFLTVCFESGDLGDAEKATRLAGLLRTICGKFREIPSLVDMFLYGESRASDAQEEQKVSGNSDRLIVVTALVTIVDSESTEGALARDGILKCIQTTNPRMTQILLKESKLCMKLVHGIVDRYKNLPNTIEVITSDSSEESKQNAAFDTLAHKDLIQWLKYVNQVTLDCYDVFAEELVSLFDSLFLKNVLRTAFMHMEEGIARTATYHTRKLLLPYCSAPSLRNCLLRFLIGQVEGPEQLGVDAEKAFPVRTTLIKRIHHMSDDLSLETISLFDYLISLRDQSVIENLLLRNLRPRAHIIPEKLAEVKVEDVRLKLSVSDIFEMFVGLQESQNEISLDEYLVDAQASISCWMESYRYWDAPDEQKSSSDSQEFYEGLFLRTIFNKLDVILTNKFAVNLKITSIFARILAIPDPFIHSFFLDPKLPTKPGIRLFLTILRDIWDRARKQMEKIPQSRKRLEDARRAIDTSAERTMIEAVATDQFFQGVMVLEEFLKELVSICQAKHTLESLSKLAEESGVPVMSPDLTSKTSDIS
jgi:hypothetical protein